MNAYCPSCRKTVEYRIERRDIKEFRGKKINIYENVGVCNKCNRDLYINNLEEENNERIYKAYGKRPIKHDLRVKKLKEGCTNLEEMWGNIEE